MHASFARAGSAILLLALSSVSAPALAQAVQPTAATEGAPADGLADIVVTARRRAEQAQDVPVSVTALSGDALEQRNVRTIESLSALAPNLNINQSSGAISGSVIAIRGISDNNPTVLTNDPPVGLYLDGVYLGRTAGGIFDIVDLERVEVLRGPQGALFGRNTTGGAVSLVTSRPKDTFGIQQKVSYGSFDEWTSRTRIDLGELGDSGIALRLAYAHRQRDGFFDNPLVEDRYDPGALNTDTVFASLHGDWSNFRWDVRGDYQNRKGVASLMQAVAADALRTRYFGASPNFGGRPFVLSTDRLKTLAVDFRGRASAEIWGVSNTFEYDLSDTLTLKSISAYRALRVHEFGDLSGQTGLRGLVLNSATGAVSVQPVTPFQSQNFSRQRQVSQELQLLGDTDRLTYVAGLYYFRERVAQQNPQNFTFVIQTATGLALGIPQQRTVAYRGVAKSYAAFAQASYTPAILGDKLELTLGGRYTEDRRSLDQQDTAFGLPVPPSRQLARKWTNFSANGSVLYKFTEAVNAYARVSSGYKSGGFNPADLIGNGYDPEKVVAYEAGLKSEWFDRRLRVNIAGFYNDYKDRQISVLTTSPTGGASNSTQNAGRAKFKGIELEVTAAPVRGLILEGSLGYTDPKYKVYQFVPAAGAAPINVADEARFQYQTKITTHAAIQYSFVDSGFGVPSVRVEYNHTGQRYFLPLDRLAPFNRIMRDPGFDDVQAQISLSRIPLGRTTAELTVYGRNLLDDDKHRTAAIDFGALGFAEAQYVMPRSWGVSLMIDF
ncbi:TonB-dependent receptor [Sphingomonas jatrophae]|uniref:Iron complex outermembrane recepter protein n=1 Tax=Sphingomonas jatrophae TaxID=1166337 RepID=A0A1I6KFT0_9SPHN|nr:TonB-dependent receptor [Sphingomonas jatrophae]SFR90089.1 iron complex outermembrane recepter protein [Sphingomonas jatrophae]